MRRLRKPINIHDYPELFKVLTAAETARYFGVHKKTVISAIDDGRLAAFQVGGIWLVSKRSAKKLWGDKRRSIARPRDSSNVLE